MTIWRLRLEYWISKATRLQAHARFREPTPHELTHTHALTHAHACKHARTHTHKEILNAFPRNSNFVNAPQYYVILTLPFLLFVVLDVVFLLLIFLLCLVGLHIFCFLFSLMLLAGTERILKISCFVV